jgi:hypothetical protein
MREGLRNEIKASRKRLNEKLLTVWGRKVVILFVTVSAVFKKRHRKKKKLRKENKKRRNALGGAHIR